jgi:hypothetical protein
LEISRDKRRPNGGIVRQWHDEKLVTQSASPYVVAVVGFSTRKIFNWSLLALSQEDIYYDMTIFKPAIWNHGDSEHAHPTVTTLNQAIPLNDKVVCFRHGPRGTHWCGRHVGLGVATLLGPWQQQQ